MCMRGGLIKNLSSANAVLIVWCLFSCYKVFFIISSRSKLHYFLKDFIFIGLALFEGRDKKHNDRHTLGLVVNLSFYDVKYVETNA